MKKQCGIYMIRNKINQKYYICQSRNIALRQRYHINMLRKNTHSNTYLQAQWNKYGEDNFEFIVLMECEPDELNKKEIYLIAAYHSNNPKYGYNLTIGGDGAASPRPEITQRRVNQIRKTYNDHPEKIERCRQKTLAQFRNPEFYRQYRELRQSDEFRERERIAHIGQRMSEEAKNKIKEALGKNVLCVETGQIFTSAREAERWLPGNKNVKAVCEGARQTAGGYHWKYI